MPTSRDLKTGFALLPISLSSSLNCRTAVDHHIPQHSLACAVAGLDHRLPRTSCCDTGTQHLIKQGAKERPCAPAFPRGFHLKPVMMDREATNFGLVQTAVEVGRWMIVWKCARQGELSHCYHGQPA